MKRNLLLIATLVVFACSSMFLLSSCAKKEIVAEEEEITAPPGPEVEIVREEEVPVKVEEEVEREELVEVEPLEQVELAKVEEAKPDERALRAARFEGESVYFDFDKSFIKPEYRSVLEEKGQFLKDYLDIHVRIEGNCDERGTNEYNLALGERRSNSAKHFLVSLGVSPDRIETMSYGEERPRLLEHNEGAWAQNRRDDFVIVSE
jgi:peptidoglycan-associated lipoprotein